MAIEQFPSNPAQPNVGGNPTQLPTGTLTGRKGAQSEVNGSVQTSSSGATYVALTSQSANEVLLKNFTGTTIEYRRDGAGVADQIPTGMAQRIKGIRNASQIAIRRTDTSNTQVTLYYVATLL